MSAPGRATFPLEGLQLERLRAETVTAPTSDVPHISILDAISVLLASSRPDDHAVFSVLLRSLNCALHQVSTCLEAAAVLRLHPVTVIVSEHELPDGSWKTVQSAGCFLAAAPELIVLSADGRSTADALDSGASDVLTRPLVETLIPGAVLLGYLRWRRLARQSAPGGIAGRTCVRPSRSSVYPERMYLEHPWP